MFPHIVAARSATKLDDGGRERRVRGSADAFASELAKGTVDHGDGLRRGAQAVELAGNRRVGFRRQ
jgi:hypothetical protein